MEKEFFEGVAESTSRLMSAWGKAMRFSGGENVYQAYEKLGLPWTSPSMLTRIMDSTYMVLKSQEFIRLAAQDLQDLVKQACDPEKVGAIKEKWTQSHEALICQLFGIPSPNEVQSLLQLWQSMMESLSRAGGGVQSQFMSMALSVGWAFPAAAAACQTILPLCAEAYENTVGRFFRVPGFGLTREYEERTKKALDAETKFLKALPEFQEQLLSASKSAMDKVVDHVAKMNIEEVTPETYQVFYKIWVSYNEDSFIELFRSDRFCRTLADTVHKGLEARMKMDSVIADGLSFWNIPTNKDMEEVYEEFYQMKKKIRRLERELDDLRRTYGRTTLGSLSG
jgi:class III poly(R)-hydroxyalkanoic acid synthase PhaE subunit